MRRLFICLYALTLFFACIACSHRPDITETTVSDATATVSDTTTPWQDMVSTQAFSDWAFLTACSPTSEDGLNQLREAYPAFSDLAASPADGIPVVEALLNSDQTEDHTLGIALARLLYTLDHSTAGALQSLQTSYSHVSTDRLIADIASSSALEFFILGSAPYPLSEEGIAYFSLRCPQMAVLMEREGWLEELSAAAPAHIESLKQADEIIQATALDFLVQYLLTSA